MRTQLPILLQLLSYLGGNLSFTRSNWYLFAYSRLAYSHFAYFRQKSGICLLLKIDTKSSEPKWANQEQSHHR